MGVYLNPGNDGFRTIRNGTYVDKTGLIQYVNSTIDTPQKLTCFSRPRRFGKSFAAKMLCAYYDKSCDSRSLFGGLEIAQDASFEEHLNKYDVIYLDITRFISTAASIREVVYDIQNKVINELRESYPSCVTEQETVLADALFSVSGRTDGKFIIVIDECDALFREAKDNMELQKEYIQLLRGLFKGGTATDKTIAAAYMTGILPIKKYGTESALTDFVEFTMTEPLVLTEYIGFTEQEVIALCDVYHVDFENMKQWYDGYSFEDLASIYNPNSVMKAVRFKRIRNYWTQTESFESLKKYIDINMDGLKDDIVTMLGGQRAQIDISTFQNDITSFHNKDDVLTLLIHLGYLAYDQKREEVYIPNQEVAEAFRSAVKGGKWKPVEQAIRNAERLLDATLRLDADTAIRQIHENRYDGSLKEYFGNLLLVGINYDRDAKGAEAKRHSCVIERT